MTSTIEMLRRFTRSRAKGRNTLEALADDIDHHGAARREGLRQRLTELINALGGSTTDQQTAALLRELVGLLEPLDHPEAWLMLGTIGGNLPDSDQVRAAVRAAAEDGPLAALRLAIWSGPLPRVLDSGPFRPVHIVSNVVVVDVHHTSQTDFATGIQRVTREVTRRWVQNHQPTLIGWTADMRAMRKLTPPESRRTCWGGPAVDVPTNDSLIIPWNCTYLLPELAADPQRTGPLLAMAQYSNTTLNIIGYDLVPITTAETSQEGMRVVFARALAAARHARTIAPISEAAGLEYRGWRQMLAGTGLPGPNIQPVVLPSEAMPEDDEATSAAAERLRLGALPLVLVVGSHEPRKNHLAVLHAAELLWREGRRFSLTFIGGNAWNSDRFQDRLSELQEAGRPIESISAASDDLLFGAYRSARFTVFPSLNEGFGLPIAESLNCGTPVVTSNFGSMKEIVDAGGGGVLVDPRDDHSLADGMRALLSDDELHTRLSQEAAGRPQRTWDDYAFDTWAVLNASSASASERA